MTTTNDAIIGNLIRERGNSFAKWQFTAVLAALGFVGNYFNIDLAFGVNFLFGSVFTVLALLMFGSFSAIAVSIVASSFTFWLWGHPFGFVIFVGEAIFLSFVTSRSWPRRDVLLMDLAFWICLGMPSAFIFYSQFLHMPDATVTFIAIKQAVNGIANVMLGYIILMIFRPVLTNLSFMRYQARPWRIATLVSVGLSFSLVVPAILVLVFMNSWVLEREMTRYKKQLSDLATHEVWKIDRATHDDTVDLLKRLSALGPEISDKDLRGGQAALNAVFVSSPTAEPRFERHLGASSPIPFNSLIQGLNWEKVLKNASSRSTSVYTLEMEHGRPLIVTVLNDPNGLGLLFGVWDSSYLQSILGNNSWQGEALGLSVFSASAMPKYLAGRYRFSEDASVLFPTTDVASKVHLWRSAKLLTVIPLTRPGGTKFATTVSLKPVIDELQTAIASFLEASFLSIGFALLVVAFSTHYFQQGVSRAMVHAEKVIKDEKPDESYLKNHFLIEGRWLSKWLNLITADLTRQTIEQERIANDLTQLIDTANAPIFGIDAEGRVNEWNQAAERITGFSKNEVIGKDLVSTYITDDYKTSVKEVLDKALNGEQTANFEFPLFTKTGDRVDVLLNSTTRRDASGQIVGVVGVGQDITELNKVIDEQERIARDLTQLIDTANAPIFGIDAEGRVNEWNQAAERITGFSKKEVMGRGFVSQYIADDCKDAVKDVLDKALAGKQTDNYEFSMFTKAGDRVDVLLNSTTRRDASGEIVGVVGVGQDITEVKKSQAQVIHASKLATLGEMATSVAHELNQPLNVIRLAAGNCRMRLGRIEGNEDYLDAKLIRIEEQTERAAAIIDHMRMFGRKTVEEDAELDVCQVVRSALDLVGEQLRLSDIEVELDLPQNCTRRVMGHSIQLEQVLLNLLTNARDAILSNFNAEKKISIEVKAVGKNVKVILQDTGGGIPDKIRDRVFEPFFTTKEMGRGTGLGLSVSYGIVNDMHGTIQVKNTAAGARFEISLPSVEAS